MEASHGEVLQMSDKTFVEECARNFPVLLSAWSLATESSCTDVPQHAVLPARGKSDSSLDTTAESGVKNRQFAQVAGADDLMERLVFRSHPAMKPPPFVRLLKIDTSVQRPALMARIVDLPDFPSKVSPRRKWKVPSWQRGESLFGGTFCTLSGNETPEHAQHESVHDTKKPGVARGGGFSWWRPCGAGDTSVVVPTSEMTRNIQTEHK
jgi:hypothetical protein